VPKKTLKSVKKASKNNVIPLPKKNNVSLDRKDGVFITSLEYYRNRDLDRLLTFDDCLLILPHLLKKRTWESWRSHNKDNKEEIGPQYRNYGRRVFKVKVYWLCRYVKGENWEHEPLPTAANNIDQQKSASSNI